MKEKISVLIADDNMEFAYTLKRCFDLHDNMEVVDIARDGEDAFKKILEYKPDVVFPTSEIAQKVCNILNEELEEKK